MTPPDSISAPAPHGGRPVLHAGDWNCPRAVVILLHGRGATASDILSLAPPLAAPGIAFLAPQAGGNSWYPASFLAPASMNQVGVHSAHAVIEAMLKLLSAEGFDASRLVLAGFSQGACLAADHVFRYPRAYGALIAFTGGLIGPPDAHFTAQGDLAGTPVLLASSDPDPHVPRSRVEQTARVLTAMGAKVNSRFHAGYPHAVHPDDLAIAREMLMPPATPAAQSPK